MPASRGRVSRDGDRTDLVRRGLRGHGIQVVDDNPGTFGGEPGRQGPADAAGAAGDDDALPRDDGHSAAPPSVTPPSTTSSWPVIQDASSDSRNATAPAMSSGSPRRLSGYAAATCSSRPS